MVVKGKWGRRNGRIIDLFVAAIYMLIFTLWLQQFYEYFVIYLSADAFHCCQNLCVNMPIACHIEFSYNNKKIKAATEDNNRVWL
jgi:hypothetical protein